MKRLHVHPDFFVGPQATVKLDMCEFSAGLKRIQIPEVVSRTFVTNLNEGQKLTLDHVIRHEDTSETLKRFCNRCRTKRFKIVVQRKIALGWVRDDQEWLIQVHPDTVIIMGSAPTEWDNPDGVLLEMCEISDSAKLIPIPEVDNRRFSTSLERNTNLTLDNMIRDYDVSLPLRLFCSYLNNGKRFKIVVLRKSLQGWERDKTEWLIKVHADEKVTIEGKANLFT